MTEPTDLKQLPRSPLIERNPMIQTYQLASDLSSDSSVSTPVSLNWVPDVWYVVVRLTAGSLKIYLGQGRSDRVFRMDNGIFRLPFPHKSVTIETLAATGWYSIYAVAGVPGFEVENI